MVTLGVPALIQLITSPELTTLAFGFNSEKVAASEEPAGTAAVPFVVTNTSAYELPALYENIAKNFLLTPVFEGIPAPIVLGTENEAAVEPASVTE